MRKWISEGEDEGETVSEGESEGEGEGEDEGETVSEGESEGEGEGCMFIKKNHYNQEKKIEDMEDMEIGYEESELLIKKIKQSKQIKEPKKKKGYKLNNQLILK